MADHYIGEIVKHRSHVCKVTAVWLDPDNKRTGITIEPVEGYGFPVDIYDDQLKDKD